LGLVVLLGAADQVITAIPCVAILLLGYRQALSEPRPSGFSPYARTVLSVAAAWVTTTALMEVVLYSLAIDPLQFSGFLEFWTFPAVTNHWPKCGDRTLRNSGDRGKGETFPGPRVALT
jgi:hypothetical protein